MPHLNLIYMKCGESTLNKLEESTFSNNFVCNLGQYSNQENVSKTFKTSFEEMG